MAFNLSQGNIFKKPHPGKSTVTFYDCKFTRMRLLHYDEIIVLNLAPDYIFFVKRALAYSDASSLPSLLDDPSENMLPLFEASKELSVEALFEASLVASPFSAVIELTLPAYLIL